MNSCFSGKRLRLLAASVLCSLGLYPFSPASAQSKSLVNTSQSPHAKLHSLDIGDVKWTSGFWAERFQVCKDSMVPHLLRTYMDPNVGHAYENFRIAAGMDTGSHKGPVFHDGDFYKVLEGVVSLYAATRDPKLDKMLDTVIATIGKAQREDGYINTLAGIAERKKTSQNKAFEDRLNFETYNMGHLMTAACVHYRVTGKKNFLNIAIKATDYLNNFYKRSSPELARNAICPSHYMGVVEMYRTTRNPEYLKLAQNLINIRGLVKEGTDDNQDRTPFRQQSEAMGHAVRANYLYAGVADVYAETGEDSLMLRLNQIWDDVVYHKMYITGACGALFDGVSPYGTSYNPLGEVQKTHQAYGRSYQLPNMSAHNETCANIGNMLWNWRMFQLSGKAQYTDVLELALYNSVLSGISLDGNKFFYTNPLSASDSFPYTLRWAGGRIPYIALSNCCPPNVVRTIAEVNDYAYSLSPEGIWVNLYSGNTVSTHLENGAALQLSQETAYPWDGAVALSVKQAPKEAFSIFLRIPGWCNTAQVKVNGEMQSIPVTAGTYAELRRNWKKGDKVELLMPMETKLVEANPLVEETRNQVAVKRGPVVYCLESTDLQQGQSVFNIAVPSTIQLQPKTMQIDNSTVMSLEGQAKVIEKTSWDHKTLYHEISAQAPQQVSVRFIPYYSWGNRGRSEMSVWVPVSR